jgi:fatty acid desaturase
MAQTQRKPVYVQPEHHEILRRIAYEQRCNLSDVLDAVLEQADWEKIAKNASSKPVQRAMERGGSYKV